MRFFCAFRFIILCILLIEVNTVCENLTNTQGIAVGKPEAYLLPENEGRKGL